MSVTKSAARKGYRGVHIICRSLRYANNEWCLPYLTIKLELRTAIETYKAKEQSYQERLEAAEIARAKAARGEAYGEYFQNSSYSCLTAKFQPARRTLVETENAHSENATARKAVEDRLKVAEQRLQELEAKLDEEGRESSEVAISQQRLSEELEDERQQHQKDLAERDFTADQTRKKYQGEPQRQIFRFPI